MFESHAGVLSSLTFNQYSLPYLRQIASEVKQKLTSQGFDVVPMTVFAKDAHYALDDLINSDYDVIGLDWTIDPATARLAVKGKKKALQGNLDPAALYGSTEKIKKLTQTMVEGFGVNGYIANLGHGMYPDMEPSHLEAFVDAVHESSQEIIKQSS